MEKISGEALRKRLKIELPDDALEHIAGGSDQKVEACRKECQKKNYSNVRQITGCIFECLGLPKY